MYNAFYGAKNRLKRNVSIFYSITHTQKYPLFSIFCSYAYVRARVYDRNLDFLIFSISIYGSQLSSSQKNIFKNFFFREILNF